jgi:hypothetical protein
MPPAWTSPADVRAAVRKKWDSGALLGAFARGEEWVPLGIPLRGPAAREIGERLGDVQAWAEDWARPRLLRIEYKQVGGRHFGTNAIPCRAWVDGYDQAWELLGVRGDVRRFTALAELTRQSCPRLMVWVRRRPVKLLGLEACWAEVLDVVKSIERANRPGMYLRQLDVPGVDTKFIERHRGLLTELLDIQLDPGRVDRGAADFERRYGFRRKPAYVRFRAPMSGFSELSVRAEEFAGALPGVTRVFVVENEITYLAFPRPDDAMVIWGSGYAVPVLEPLGWLHALEIVYWGDIDTHGFVILDRLRGLFPQVRSMLMDRATLLAHQRQWVTEPVPSVAALDRLDDPEAALYRDLVAGTFGSRVRLEQERISFAAIEAALAELSESRLSESCRRAYPQAVQA